MKLQLTIAAILAGAMSVGTAQAAALATSTVQVNNFQIFKTNNDAIAGNDVVLDRVTDFGSLEFTSSANIQNTFNGNSLSASTPSVATAAGTDLFIGQGNYAPQYTNNSFGVISSATGSPIANFAVADQKELGAPITSLKDGSNVTYSSPANLGNATYVSMAGSGDGNASSTNTLGSSFTFVAAFSDILRFSLDVTSYLEAFVNGVSPTAAGASFNVTFTLVDNTTGGILLGQLINGQLFGEGVGGSVSALSPINNGIAKFSGSALGVANTTHLDLLTHAALVAGDSYTLSANTTSTANAITVPEPTILALMGIGMIGMASFRRRQVG